MTAPVPVLTPTPAYVIALARAFGFVREAQSLGQNQGQRVNAIQTWSGGRDAIGSSWCAWFATMILDIAYAGVSPIPREGSCETIRRRAEIAGMLTNTPAPGDLFLYLTPSGYAHHVGIVTGVNPLVGIAGNTSADGVSTNGDGVYEHAISIHSTTFVRYLGRTPPTSVAGAGDPGSVQAPGPAPDSSPVPVPRA